MKYESKTAQNPRIEQNWFSFLPSEITLEILSRVPAPTAMRCKCVCKRWLNLLTTPEFVKSQISNSVPSLVVFENGEDLKSYKIVESGDEHRWNIVFNSDLPFHKPAFGSVHGLLFLCEGGFRRGGGDLSLCNPITRDYITIPSPPWPPFRRMFHTESYYGFGVSRTSHQYKVVRVFFEREFIHRPIGLKCDRFECQVYTVGTGSWRQIASCGPLRYAGNLVGTYLKGILHWLAHNGSSRRISCLDLETEVFSSFSPPPLDDIDKCRSLSVLGDCLCVCDNSEFWQTSDDEIDIWLLKKYEDEKSWTKEFVIRKADMYDHLGFLCPIKVFKDGDILMELGCKLLYYSSKTKTIEEADNVLALESNIRRSTTIFAPSFLSLRTFAMENVVN